MSLTVPCQNKHNFDPNGQLAHEIVKEDDLSTMLDFLKGAIFIDNVSLHSERILRTDVDFPQNSPAAIEKKRKELLGAFRWALPRLRTEHLYPENLQETAKFVFGSANSFRSR